MTFGRGSTISTIKSTYKNWMGPSLASSFDTACYRETHIAKICPLEFENHHDICWAECPISYPIECGMECIRQNDDCGLEVVAKVSVVAQAAFSLATFGLYGEFKLMAKGVKIAYKCGKEMMNLVRQMTKFVRTIKVFRPHSTEKYLEAVLYQTDNVVFDLPVTICTCLGLPVSETVRTADRITNTVELVVKEIVTNSALIASWASFKAFMKRITLEKPIEALDESDISSLQSALKSKSTCGYSMKRLLDRTWMTVANLRKQDPDISEAEVRLEMSKSNLVLYEIPTVTNNCMKELIEQSDVHSAYTTRDTLRKSFGAITDDLIRSGTSHNGTLLTAEKYAYQITDKALGFYAVWDVTNIGHVVTEYFQTICGPTKFTGEIDDGSAKDALGLRTVGDAFKGSSGNWTKRSDGIVTVTFQSIDTEDVTINVKSGGNKLAEVVVPAGKTVIWTSNVKALGGKTLYLDRWRPGFLGLPGTGGGSLLLWVPRSTQSGSLQLTAMLNAS
ncbi:hypothetical protein PHMEG_00022461 [Phytophthora megakarya]|uniref:Jacalin-type lectin domain-containing protein n=1 Tax=Phytophthora megakarya TaxID=4795 RepID=A0A225VJE9_9STRA|nr:hypothetical protein PHMEG_00022461 [Phytophthora megakarya]